MNTTSVLFVAVMSFAAGVIAMDLAHEHRFGVPASTAHAATGQITRAGLTSRQADKLCAHYQAAGQGHRCDELNFSKPL